MIIIYIAFFDLLHKKPTTRNGCKKMFLRNLMQWLLGIMENKINFCLFAMVELKLDQQLKLFLIKFLFTTSNENQKGVCYRNGSVFPVCVRNLRFK